MRKGEIGLQRCYKLGELQDRYDELYSLFGKLEKEMRKLGFRKLGVPKRVVNLFNMIFRSFPANEFMDKDHYVWFIKEIKEIEAISDDIDKVFRAFGNDFANFSLFEFIVLATDLLEIGTYDSLICPDYPCTEELILNGGFSYYEVGDEENEIRVDTPEKCWEYLKQNYDALED